LHRRTSFELHQQLADTAKATPLRFTQATVISLCLCSGVTTANAQTFTFSADDDQMVLVDGLARKNQMMSERTLFALGQFCAVRAAQKHIVAIDYL
jgi:hypothetical protein